jgi:hypothetical protein
MLVHRMLFTALAAATVVALPAAAGAATASRPPASTPVAGAGVAAMWTGPALSSRPPAPPPATIEDPYPGGFGDNVVLPAGHPVAVLEVTPVALRGQLVEVVLDDSTGDVVAQELTVYEPDGDLSFIIRCDGAPDPGCWVRFSTPVRGTYTLTLTATGPSGLTDTVTREVAVIQLVPIEFP